MENQNEPLLIRPSRTPKTNPQKNFCSRSLPPMVLLWFLCVTFYVCLQNLCKKLQNLSQKLGKSHTKPNADDARLK